MLKGQKMQAEMLRHRLRLGFTTVADVVAWARWVVHADPAPDRVMVWLAIADEAPRQTVVRLLDGVREPNEPACEPHAGSDGARDAARRTPVRWPAGG